MPKRIVVRLSPSSINAAIQQLEDYKKSLTAKARELARRLADYGLTIAQIGFSGAVYDGPRDTNVTVEENERGYVIRASGGTVLFIEFGAGVTYGYGHPQAAEFGMGPGTYPDGKGHWNDPRGWYLPKSAGGGHSFGNPPNMPMYNAAKDLRREIENIAREVFGRD